MSDSAFAFAPVRVNIYSAPVGTATPGAPGSPIGVAWEDHGAVDLAAGYTLNVAGQPTRTVEREFYDDQVFYVTKSPSDDLPSIDITFMETNDLVLEDAFGVAVESDGTQVYFGGIPDNKAYVLDLAEAGASPKYARFWLPNGAPSVNGSISASAANKLLKWPIRFTAETSEDIGGALWKAWWSFLPDVS